MIWAAGITASILLLEAVGGILSGSLALLSDAGHMLTDLAALLISLAAVIMAEKPANGRHTFGLARLEVLAALGNSMTFFVMVAALVWEALHRLAHPVLPEWHTMGLVALAGLSANLLSAWLLHGAHEHDLNMRSAWLHVMGDLLSSVGVLVGVGVIAWRGWTWVDPILSLGIAFLIALGGVKLFRKALHILLESAPRGLTVAQVEEALIQGVPEILEVHHVHLWEVGAGEIHLTAHLVVKDRPMCEGEAILQRANQLLGEKFGIHHSTFQLEAPGPRS
jgi:cobalt-zinc-cadmium efflux system protein